MISRVEEALPEPATGAPGQLVEIYIQLVDSIAATPRPMKYPTDKYRRLAEGRDPFRFPNIDEAEWVNWSTPGRDRAPREPALNLCLGHHVGSSS